LGPVLRKEASGTDGWFIIPDANVNAIFNLAGARLPRVD
jgi:hypothetical protein